VIRLIYLPEDYKTLGLMNPLTEAIVVPKGSNIRKDVDFYKTVCVNGGNNVSIFENRDQALGLLNDHILPFISISLSLTVNLSTTLSGTL
jgi:hypothetical protein